MSVICDKCGGELLIYLTTKKTYGNPKERYYRCRECQKEFILFEGMDLSTPQEEVSVMDDGRIFRKYGGMNLVSEEGKSEIACRNCEHSYLSDGWIACKFSLRVMKVCQDNNDLFWEKGNPISEKPQEDKELKTNRMYSIDDIEELLSLGHIRGYIYPPPKTEGNPHRLKYAEIDWVSTGKEIVLIKEEPQETTCQWKKGKKKTGCGVNHFESFKFCPYCGKEIVIKEGE